MGIAWIKRPEGATHALEGKVTDNFYRFHEDCWQLWCGDQWAISADWDGWFSVPPCFVEFPDPWNGEGLPPVGVVCEFQGDEAKCPYDPWHEDLHDGVKCTVIAHFKSKSLDLVAFTFVKADGNTEVEQSLPGALKPIRTPEQIAAEECDKAVKAMLSEFEHTGSLTSHYEVCEVLHKAGYRKQTDK
jgi:hypothetical protein